MASVGLVHVGAMLIGAVLIVNGSMLLGLEREELTRFTGLVVVVAGVVPYAVPAFLLPTGVRQEDATTWAVAQAVVLLLSLAMFPVFRNRHTTTVDAPAHELREGVTAAQVAGTSQPNARGHGNVVAEQPVPGVPDAPADRRR